MFEIRIRSGAEGNCVTKEPLCCNVNATEGLTNAIRSNSCMMLLSSVWLDLRNFLRAGTLKKRFLTSKFAPTGHAHGSCETILDPSISTWVPSSFSMVRVVSLTCATAAIDGSASPRNPMVFSANKSSAFLILDVAWRSNARRASVSLIPFPSSTT